MIARLPMRVCIWLALHPDQSLTLAQISTMFDMDTRHAWKSLSVSAVRDGLIAKEIRLAGAGPKYMVAHYSAGPELLTMRET
jgi:hypothetical protein